MVDRRVRIRGLAAAVRRAALLVLGMTGAALACEAPTPCAVPNGQYEMRLPAGWDGRTPLAALVYLHGYTGSARETMENTDLLSFAAREGLVLVALQGSAIGNRPGYTWSHPGSPTQARDEFAYVDAVLADLASRVPLDRRRLWASGFSQGGSMVWYLACERGDRFAAYVSFAGAFWRPEPTACPSGPRSLFHVHGHADATVPMRGRPILGAFHQGDVQRGMALWRRTNACPVRGERNEAIGALSCEISETCGSGQVLRLCLHAGGHDFDIAWLKLGWDWVRRRADERSGSN